VKGLDQWRQLFKPIRSEQLTDEQIRGLAAELFCILELFRTERSWAEIIQGWVGPLGAPQDFVLGDGLVVETKSFHPDSTSIRIASLSQLDIPEQQRLALIGVVISRETADSVGALTLPLMCERISTALEGMFDLADEFRLKLRELRFDPNDPVYAEHFFVARSPKAFAVRGDFPRIVRADVRAGVKDAEYFISMSEVDAFEIELDQLRPGREGDPWT
jgi:hypothetical protein